MLKMNIFCFFLYFFYGMFYDIVLDCYVVSCEDIGFVIFVSCRLIIELYLVFFYFFCYRVVCEDLMFVE